MTPPDAEAPHGRRVLHYSPPVRRSRDVPELVLAAIGLVVLIGLVGLAAIFVFALVADS